MTRYLGPAFHEICAITRKWGDNPWNGAAAKSLELLPDNRPIVGGMTEREFQYLRRARQIYTRLL